MIAYEALNTSPKAPKANIKNEDTKNESSLSFESMLKSISKKDTTNPETTLVILPREDDTKSQLLHLLKKPIESDQKEIPIQQTSQEITEEEPTSQTLDSLLKLLKSDDPKKIKDAKAPVNINQEISEKLSPTEVKYLVYKAKQYLKDKIESNPEFNKKYDIKELPNNLKSLVSIAKELKIDIKNITYEDLNKQTQKTTPQQQDDLLDLDIESNVKNQQSQKIQITTKTVKQNEEFQKTITTKLESVKNTPILKETQTTVTTQQIINSKELKNTTKQETTQNDLLKKLLKTDIKKDETTLQQNKLQQKHTLEDLFTSKQEASNDTQNENGSTKKQTLEELLRNDTNSQNNQIKPVQTHKSDSVEVKINEAKQMMKFLSEDIKKAIDDYKPPFSRLKVQLNPQQLGEIDLTVVQRGKNVHINLSSNNAALNILANNLNELKTQLNQNGINNASFNFNSQSDQRQDQGRERAKQEYSYFANEDEENENFKELEIVIPRYI